MASIGPAIPTSGRRLLAFPRIDSPIAPVVVVASFLALLLAIALAAYHGQIAGLVTFGRLHIADTAPPRGIPMPSLTPNGYDGQLYWIQAHDPLLLSRSTITHLARAYPGYFLQRPAYPALAFILGAGQASLLPWTLLLINIASVVVLISIVSDWARRCGRSVWWGAVIGLMPGVLMPVLRDLSDLFAVTLMVGGMVSWRLGRQWLAAALLAVAVLAREPMLLAVVAIGCESGVLALLALRDPRKRNAIVARACPAVLIPALAFFGWQLYISTRVASVGVGNAQASGGAVSSLSGYAAELNRIFAHSLSLPWAWDLAYVIAMLLGSLLALYLLRRGRRASVVAAVLFAASLVVITFGDWWGEARYSMPMFAMLLISGLELRSRLTLGLCAAVALLGVMIPFSVPGI